MRSAREGERGSLLVDYFVAAAIFFTAFGVAVSAAAVRGGAVADGEGRLRAVAAAESALAELQAGKAVEGERRVEGLAEGMLRVRTEAEDGLRRAEVRVRWRDGGGERVEVELWSVLP